MRHNPIVALYAWDAWWDAFAEWAVLVDDKLNPVNCTQDDVDAAYANRIRALHVRNKEQNDGIPDRTSNL